MDSVALLAEGVDRNCSDSRFWTRGIRSPSSRRAWIEMLLPTCEDATTTSPSSRRAWIEIKKVNFCIDKEKCRPPRGGRG